MADDLGGMTSVTKIRPPIAIRIPLAALILASCGPAPDGAGAAGEDATAGSARDSVGAQSIAIDSTAPANAVYVPIYSRIYYGDARRAIELTATLSVRNTDVASAITVTAIRYYDSEGRLVRSEIDAPLLLGPLATRDFVVEERDRTGGAGANFIVEWRAAERVSEPVIEAVMIGQQGAQGISFISVGRALTPPP